MKEENPPYSFTFTAKTEAEKKTLKKFKKQLAKFSDKLNVYYILNDPENKKATG